MNDQKIRLLFTGDFAPLIDSSYINSKHFLGIEEIIDNCDLHITNLECPLTKSENKIQKTGPHIKASIENVKLLHYAKVNIACLANNHIFDFGEQGIKETINVCKETGIDCIGIVNRDDGEKQWIIKEIKGRRIGFINYCEHEFSVRDDGLLGACGYDPINAFYDIQFLKTKVDYIIVIYHGGNEYYPLPNPQLKRDFHYIADLGADAVIGHHTHVISGFEIYKAKPLVYSLGNFFFPYPNEPEEWHISLICELIIDDNINIKFHPVIQCKNNLDVILVNESMKNQITQKIDNLSKILNNNEKLEKAWQEYASDKKLGYLKNITGLGKVGNLLLKLGYPEDRLIKKIKVISLYNLLRCRAHFELMMSSLKLKL